MTIAAIKVRLAEQLTRRSRATLVRSMYKGSATRPSRLLGAAENGNDLP
jgi:hypothetical protein